MKKNLKLTSATFPTTCKASFVCEIRGFLPSNLSASVDIKQETPSCWVDKNSFRYVSICAWLWWSFLHVHYLSLSESAGLSFPCCIVFCLMCLVWESRFVHLEYDTIFFLLFAHASDRHWLFPTVARTDAVCGSSGSLRLWSKSSQWRLKLDRFACWIIYLN